MNKITLDICIWDWKSYNNGKANFKWFSLPNELKELENHLCDLEEKGLEEAFVCDTDGWNDTITEHTSINKLIDVMLNIENLDQFDLLEEYYEQYPDDRIYYFDNNDLHMLFDDDLENFANRVHFGSYNALDPYLYLNGYANIVTIPEHKKEEYEQSYIRTIVEQYINN